MWYDGPCGRDLADNDDLIEHDNREQEWRYEVGCWMLGLEPWENDMVFDQPKEIK